MQLNEISGAVVDAAYKVHTVLGPGLLESVYEAAMEHELKGRKLQVGRQVGIPVYYEGVNLEEGFRADLIVEDAVIVEIKSVEKMSPLFSKQLLTYLRVSGKKLGLLINFGSFFIKDGIERIVKGWRNERLLLFAEKNLFHAEAQRAQRRGGNSGQWIVACGELKKKKNILFLTGSTGFTGLGEGVGFYRVRKVWRVGGSVAGFLVWHSQRMRICQPSCFRARRFFLSRVLLARRLDCQNGALVFGVTRPYLQLCMCSTVYWINGFGF